MPLLRTVRTAAFPVILLVAACARTATPTADSVASSAAPSTTAARPATGAASASAPPPAASSSAPAVPADVAAAKAWTDPAMVAMLARDCHYQPPPAPEGSVNPLSCALAFEQSCIPDICFQDVEEKCKPGCTRACDDCGGGCAKSCETCKAQCHDDACVRACAVSCADCRQTCLRTKDQCATGKCSKEYDTCYRGQLAEWKRGKCATACGPVAECYQTCAANGEVGQCLEKCKSKMGTCPAKFLMNCAMGAPLTDSR